MVDGLIYGNFARGLSEVFIEALNASYDEGGWWRNIADDSDIFVAIRDGYLNAYYKGNSLLKLDIKSKTLVGRIHYKYLVLPSARNEYVTFKGNNPSVDPALYAGYLIKNIAEINSIKKSSTTHAGVEKIGVHDIIRSNPNIVDVEIAFGGTAEIPEGPKTPRVDFAALHEHEESISLVFFEAKHFSNAQLRAAGDKDPPVLGQLRVYNAILQQRADDIREAYVKAFRCLAEMKGQGIRHPVRDRLMKMVVAGEKAFVVDTSPRLVIFGFDDDQKKGSAWAPHLEKLQKALVHRLICRGNTVGLTTGITLRDVV